MERIIAKEGYLYDDIRKMIKPLDIILFKGPGFVSDAFRILQHKSVKNSFADNYSHVGIIVNNKILDYPNMEDDVLYIWEAVMSSPTGYNINNIDGESFFGTQLRNFDELILKYDKPMETNIAWCQLNNNPYDDKDNMDELKSRFTEIFGLYNGIKYDINFFSLLASGYKILRPLRALTERIFRTDRWLFCSELCANVYIALNLLPSNIDPRNVLPIDFIPGVDADNDVPNYMFKYPVRITIIDHYDPNNRVELNKI